MVCFTGAGRRLGGSLACVAIHSNVAYAQCEPLLSATKEAEFARRRGGSKARRHRASEKRCSGSFVRESHIENHLAREQQVLPPRGQARARTNIIGVEHGFWINSQGKPTTASCFCSESCVLLKPVSGMGSKLRAVPDGRGVTGPRTARSALG